MKHNQIILKCCLLITIMFSSCQTEEIDNDIIEQEDPSVSLKATSACEVTIENLASHTRIIYRANDNATTIRVNEWRNGKALTIRTSSGVCKIPQPYDELFIYGGKGNDSIIINRSVKTLTKIYPGDGNDFVRNISNTSSTIVSLGGGTDKVIGNKKNTRFWIDSEDTHNASAQEIEEGKLHLVEKFNNSSKVLDGREIRDDSQYERDYDYCPWDFIPMERTSLWGIDDPSVYDVQQGYFQTCGATSFWGYLAHQFGDKVREWAVELGDGTYGVKISGGEYVRMDADFQPFYYSRPGPTGKAWHVILQKAYHTNFKYDFPAPVTSSNGFHIKPLNYTSISSLIAELKKYLNNDTYIVKANCIKANFDLGLSRNHVFTVLGVENGNVIIRNPYGDVTDCFAQYPHEPNPKNGRVEMDFELLQEYISEFYITEVAWR